jgi:hypothetical protein
MKTDVHHDIKFTDYRTWLEQDLIPNLKLGSVIVVESSSYHRVNAEDE